MELEAAYQETLDYLYRFVDYSLTRSFRYSPDKFDLGRMRVLMERLGNPQDSYPIIHVAGTKGKGSVTAMCASALRAAGYRVGHYTSPHLHDYTERIQVDGEPISHQDLVDLVAELKPHLEKVPELTTFEITTALAFLHFARHKVNAAVFEVGLGGRLDATNIVIPKVCVITSLSYDHTQYLGETLTEIAGEKAGIIKEGIPVVLAPQKDEARLTIERIAAERNAPLFEVGRDYLFTPLSHSLVYGQSFQIWPAAQIDNASDSEEATRLQIPLLGYHQVENAATAYAALQVARTTGLSIEEADIRRGFSQVVWLGRFEVLQQAPPLVVDSAHNRDSALKLRLALDDYFPGRPVILVFGASEDKDIEGMFAELMPRVSRLIATRSFHPRAIEPERLVELAQRYDRPAQIIIEVEDALEEALRVVDGDAMILATGSLFIAAATREVWYKRRAAIQS